MTDNYIPIKEYAEIHGVQAAYLRRLIGAGRITDVMKVRGRYYILTDAKYPKDRRKKSGEYVGWRKKYPGRNGSSVNYPPLTLRVEVGASCFSHYCIFPREKRRLTQCPQA